jgi:hypothetical protein
MSTRAQTVVLFDVKSSRPVGDLKLQEVIIHKKVQEGPSTPLQNPQEE